MQETYLEVNIDKIRNNIIKIKNLNHRSKFCAVVKANAYGLGSDIVGREIEDLVDYFAVARLSEGILLRRAGIKKPILILGYVGLDDISKCFENDIDISVYDLGLAKEIDKLGYKLKAHLVLDTGHGRIGFRADQIENIRQLKTLSNIKIISAFSHFSTADEEDNSFTEKQEEIFDYIIEQIKNDFDLEFVHLANSAGTIRQKIFKDMYRIGICLYGLYPSEVVRDNTEIKLEKTFKLYSFVHFIKNIDKGTPISYGRTFVSSRPMKVATVAIGYADGYYRAFSNKGKVYINGYGCKVLGRVCMDQMMVDVTGLDVKIGDRVEIYKDIDKDADLIGTISYELMTNISMRVKRIYIKDGVAIAKRDYLGEIHES